MNFERRHFLRAGTVGLAGSVFALETAFGQNAGTPPVARFKGGTGSISEHLQLSAGTLDLDSENFVDGDDAGAVMRGWFTPKQGPRVSLYRSYFCTNHAEQIFCRLIDDSHKTTFAMINTDVPDVVSLTMWHDDGVPDSFRISKKSFLAVATAQPQGRLDPSKYVLGGRGSDFHPDGARTPLPITMEEIIDAVDNNKDYLAYSRGKSLAHQHATHVVFGCYLCARVFDVLTAAKWEGSTL